MMTQARKVTRALRKTYHTFQRHNGWDEAARAGFDVSNQGVACTGDPVTLGVFADWCAEHDAEHIRRAEDYFRAVRAELVRMHKGYRLDRWVNKDVKSARFDMPESLLRATAEDAGHGWATDCKVLFRADGKVRRKLHALAAKHIVTHGSRGGRVLGWGSISSILDTARNRVKHGVAVSGDPVLEYDHDGGYLNGWFMHPSAKRVWIDFKYLQLLWAVQPGATLVIHDPENHWAATMVRDGEVVGLVMPLSRD